LEAKKLRSANILILLLIAATFAGCARNVTRIDRSETMAEAGRKTIDATLKMAGDATKANEAAIVEIAVYDPQCELPQPKIAIGAKTGLCTGDAGARAIPFFRATKQDLLPTLAVTRGIATYLDAIDEIVGRDSVDIAGSLSAVQEDLRAVQTIIGLNAIPQLSNKQDAAVASALELIGTLATEAATVKDLRALEHQRDQAKFTASLDALDTLNAGWINIFKQSMKSQFSLINDAYRAAPPTDPDTRRALVSRQMEINGYAESAPELEQALKSLNVTFRQAHADYLALLPAGSKAALTQSEKRKEAAIIKARVRAALQSVATLVLSF
jgi:hypothetical protein